MGGHGDRGVGDVDWVCGHLLCSKCFGRNVLYDYDMTEAAADTSAPLDAYSRTVIAVAETLGPSVANLQVTRRTRRGPATGAGSGVVISCDGFLITSAHVVDGARRGTASFDDGNEIDVPGGRLGPAV